MADFQDYIDGAVNLLEKAGIMYWLRTPDPSEDHHDDIWHHHDYFNGEWFKIQNRLEWYESPNVPTIYEDHKYIFKANMEMSRPEETYYKQNVDSNKFRSEMDSRTDLPSGRGEMRISTRIKTKNPPSGENDFCLVDYNVDTEIRYDMPGGITFLPRILARPLNNMFVTTFFLLTGEEMLERDGEYAIEKTREYFQYLRKYHGEEPTQTKTRQAEFSPTNEEGVFFQ